MDLDTFNAELGRLRAQCGRPDSNLASFQCEDCLGCASCMFCQRCESCFHCTHCLDCASCSSCTHCRNCQRCHECAYCLESVRCHGSAYLTLCQDCVDSTYCYGCVGLVKKEFHILNLRYPRKDYFEITTSLEAARAAAANPHARTVLPSGRARPVP
ncbi:MAG: caib/baif family protein [Polyangia bacterium]|nr:caib/baif family protein [Polyangia bacterium]